MFSNDVWAIEVPKDPIPLAFTIAKVHQVIIVGIFLELYERLTVLNGPPIL